MKPLIPILIVASTSLAVASVQLYRQAETERARADAEMALRQKSEARIAQLERAQQGTREALPFGPPPPPGDATSQPGDKAADAGIRAAGVAGSRDGRVGPENGMPPPPPPEMFGRGPRFMESPAARNFMRSRVKSNLRRMYEDVGPALGVSADKANQLVELLADQQSRNMGRPPQPPEGQTMQQYFSELQQKNQAEIAALIGQDKVDEWQAYQKTLPDRMQLNQVREQLDNAGVPMTDSQRTEMLAAISEETQRSPRPQYNAGLPPEEMSAQMNQWQADYDKAVMDRAKQVLSSEQYKAYKEYQDWQSEMRNSFAARGGRGGALQFRSVAPAGISADATFIAPAIEVIAPPPPPASN